MHIVIHVIVVIHNYCIIIVTQLTIMPIGISYMEVIIYWPEEFMQYMYNLINHVKCVLHFIYIYIYYTHNIELHSY